MGHHVLDPQEFVEQVANTDGPLCAACGFHHEVSPGHPSSALKPRLEDIKYYNFTRDELEAWFQMFKLKRRILIDLSDKENARLEPDVDQKKKLEDEGTNVA